MQKFLGENIRNLVFVSHSGTGKTTLAEAMMFKSGTINRLGRVEDGNTISDYEPEEVKRQTSVQTSVIPCVWNNNKLNVLDTPGYADFFGEVKAGVGVADAAVVVVAAPSGVEVGTEILWTDLEEQSLPRIIFINKMDRDNADFARCLHSIQATLGKKCVAIQSAVGAQDSFMGVIDLIQPLDTLDAEVEILREQLIESVAECDDQLTTKYLEEETLTLEELGWGLKKGILEGSIVPVLVGSAARGIGVEQLMDFVVSYLPSPIEAPAVRTLESSGGGVEIAVSADGSLAASVFKTSADPFVGKLSYFRVYSGTFKSNSEIWNVNKNQSERVAQLFVPRGKTQEPVDLLVAGDIGAVAKLSVTVTGDTLGQRDKPLQLNQFAFPAANYTMALYPQDKSELDKMASSLPRLAEEDPSLHIYRHPETGETLMAGLGDVHLEVTLAKVKRKFGLDLLVQAPRVPYRETITSAAKVEYKHKKQTGGHGQYGHVFLELQPQDRGVGFEFGSSVVGGNVPKEYIPAVEKGVMRTLQEGIIAGYPVVDVKITLYDGSSHPVDSSGMAFEIAGSYAVRQGVTQAQPCILEPVMLVEVTVPDNYTGEVIGDLNTKRGRILGTSPLGGSTAVQAEVPQSEMLRYATELRSLTHGRGLFSMEFQRYDPLPAHLTQRVADGAKKS